MERKIIEQYYKNRGLNNYQLHVVDDILFVHGINILEIEGYNTLTEKNKELFRCFIVNFFNAWGLEARSTIFPISIHYVFDIERLGKEYDDDPDDVFVTLNNEVIVMKCLEGDVLYSAGKHLRNYMNKDYKHLRCVDTIKKYYLRFSYKIYEREEWLHVITPTEWY